MFGDAKASPSKGKAQDESRWQSGWWDFYSLAEGSRRPVVWTQSCSILTAHANQPFIIGRLFPSYKSFHIPSPPGVLSSLGSYEPPTVISVSPGDDWLFAYFPGRDVDGIGCLWKRGSQIDLWTIKEWWSFARGAGVIAAEWGSPRRQWTSDDNVTPSRRPAKGPRVPISDPTLFLVTQSHQFTVCLFRHHSSASMQVMTCSLTQPCTVYDNHSNASYGLLDHTENQRICTHAAIGLGYNESSILVAMRSYTHPVPKAAGSSYGATNLDLSLDLSQPSLFDPISEIEWEACGDDSDVQLCEVRFMFDGEVLSLSTTPLHSIHGLHHQLSHMVFVAKHVDPGNPSFGNPVHPNDPDPENCLYLASAFLNFDDFTCAPKSEIRLYRLARNPPPPDLGRWNYSLKSSKSLTSGVLALLAPCIPTSRSAPIGLYSVTLDTSGVLLKGRQSPSKAKIGTVSVMNLDNLNEDYAWMDMPLVSKGERLGGDFPYSYSISPNGTLFCTVSPLKGGEVHVHRIPSLRPVTHNEPNTQGKQAMPFAHTIATALRTRSGTADIAHVLALPATSPELSQILYEAYTLLESSSIGLANVVTHEYIGFLVEVYRFKAQHTQNETEKKSLNAAWLTAQAMCSVAACTIALRDCQDVEGYDLEAVWQLVALSNWLIDLLETLIKDCILISHHPPPSNKSDIKVDGHDVFQASSPHSPSGSADSTPMLHSLIHLCHPYALDNLQAAVGHVKRFYDYLGSMSAISENAQMARDVLIDTINYSGIHVAALHSLFAQFKDVAQSFSADEHRKMLSHCSPPAETVPRLSALLEKLTSSTTVDKARLFIKPTDLADSVSRLSLAERPSAEPQRDVVSKTVLLHHGLGLACTRCGGKSELTGAFGGAGHKSLRWRAWEKVWGTRCVCGGFWTSRM